jgi:hypothetical protein
VSAGELPPGLSLTNEGVIKGWPEAPTALTTTIPTVLTSTFTVSLTNNSTRDSVTFSIIVRNQKLTKPANTRVPAILNTRPLITPIPSNDPFLPYYFTDNKLLDAVSGENYTFKVIGHDFDNNELIYQFSNLPPGLSGNANTGWIAGVPVVAPNTLSQYTFSVTVAKANNREFASKPETYTLLVNNGVIRDIVWDTSSDLGTIDNGTIYCGWGQTST